MITQPRPPRFDAGEISITPGVRDATTWSERITFLSRHVTGDWGEVSPEDAAENEFSLPRSLRLLSRYTAASGAAIWIITEADRSATTMLLPEEYSSHLGGFTMTIYQPAGQRLADTPARFSLGQVVQFVDPEGEDADNRSIYVITGIRFVYSPHGGWITWEYRLTNTSGGDQEVNESEIEPAIITDRNRFYIERQLPEADRSGNITPPSSNFWQRGSVYISIAYHQLNRDAQSADLAGENGRDVYRAALAALDAERQYIAELIMHTHQWDEHDFCSICGADGRA